MVVDMYYLATLQIGMTSAVHRGLCHDYGLQCALCSSSNWVTDGGRVFLCPQIVVPEKRNE